MALRITDRDVNGVSVLDMDGKIVLGDESNSLRERFKTLMAAGKKKIVLNMDGSLNESIVQAVNEAII